MSEHRRHLELCATPPGSTSHPCSCLHGQNNDESESVLINCILVVIFIAVDLINFPVWNNIEIQERVKLKAEYRNETWNNNLVTAISKASVCLCFPPIISCAFLWKFSFTKNCYLCIFWRWFWLKTSELGMSLSLMAEKFPNEGEDIFDNWYSSIVSYN